MRLQGCPTSARRAGAQICGHAQGQGQDARSGDDPPDPRDHALGVRQRQAAALHSPSTRPWTLNCRRRPGPRVQPWEPEELGRFLDQAARDPLSALFEVAAFTGLRRGELLGLQWEDVDVERSRLTVRRQIVQLGHETRVGPVKTAGGQDRVVDLDAATVAALLAHRLRQEQYRTVMGAGWVESGHVFTREDGSTLDPHWVTKRFREVCVQAGVRPIRLHDLRHGQASLMLAAGVPMAVVSKRLGHSSLAITSDTYSHLLEGVGQQAATAAAALVPRNDLRTQNEHSALNGDVTGGSAKDIAAGQTGGPPGDRTQNPRIKSPLLCQLS